MMNSRSTNILSGCASLLFFIMELCSLGCATTRSADLPTITIDKVWTAAPRSEACISKPRSIKMTKGGTARGDVVASLTLRSDREAPLETYEKILVQWTGRYCLDGVVLHRAEGSAGTDGFLLVEASVWEATED